MKRQLRILITLGIISMITSISLAKEYHVSVNGCDTNKGSKSKPFKTIQAAADVAQPGDVITVHEGIYRERVNPPRGGTSDKKRITYRAAKSEKVAIKGSEIVKGWEKAQDDTWKVVIPNTFFSDFNPFNDLIHGDWFYPKGRDHHTGAVYLNGHWLTEAAKFEEVQKPIADTPLWFAKVDDKNTTVWAQFKDVNPNEAEVEVNVRRTVFYPDKPGRNYITVRGFTMTQAATPWAPPTAEQIGLLGTHWSKGWIIEDNDISYSTCVGVTLGKYGDQWDNKSEDTATGYVKTIEHALENGWSKENIGHHIVRNNHISHCEQAGLVGSLGAVYSTITHNKIHDIYMRKLFWGAEMGCIKIHAAVDTLIKDNYLYNCGHWGLWLDWMAQGTRVTGNLIKNCAGDVFMEVNHGPILLDNNIFLSETTLVNWSEGAACVHNLFAGELQTRNELNRETPILEAHGTKMAGLRKTYIGDDRFYNNIFIGKAGLTAYDNADFPMYLGGNVYLNGAQPGKDEKEPLVEPNFNPNIKLVEKDDGMYLHMTLDKTLLEKQTRPLVTTKLLGKAKVPDLPYVKPDDSPLKIDTDYFGKKRNTKNPSPGPFRKLKDGELVWKVW